jgi:hypothetical protein
MNKASSDSEVSVAHANNIRYFISEFRTRLAAAHSDDRNFYAALIPGQGIEQYLDANLVQHGGLEENSAFQGLNMINTYILDDFLYSQIEKLELLDTGKILPYYCTNCNNGCKGLQISQAQILQEDEDYNSADEQDELVFEPIPEKESENNSAETLPERKYCDNMTIHDILRAPLSCPTCKQPNLNKADSVILPRTQITFSHSFIHSRNLIELLNDNIPHIHSKQLLDIGSRLGNMLLLAAYFSPLKRIIGVEIEEWFVVQCKSLFKTLKLSSRIKLFADSIENRLDLLHNSDIIVLFNPFELSYDQAAHRDMLNLLVNHVNRGTKQYLVATPAIEVIVSRANAAINTQNWLERIDNYQDTVLYRVR